MGESSLFLAFPPIPSQAKHLRPRLRQTYCSAQEQDTSIFLGSSKKVPYLNNFGTMSGCHLMPNVKAVSISIILSKVKELKCISIETVTKI